MGFLGKVRQEPSRVLEIGHGGHPLGTSLMDIARDLPKGTEYHGLEFTNRYLQALASRGSSNRHRRRSFRTSKHFRDISTAENQYSRQRPRNVFLYQMDARQLAFRKSFDEVHMHLFATDFRIPDLGIRKAVAEANSVLKSGGVLIASGESQEREIGRPGYNLLRSALSEQGFQIHEYVSDLRNGIPLSKVAVVAEFENGNYALKLYPPTSTPLKEHTLFHKPLEEMISRRSKELGMFIIVARKPKEKLMDIKGLAMSLLRPFIGASERTE